ncbi:hypothetical protein U0Y27_12225, partial [Acinetobacter baumannii]
TVWQAGGCSSWYQAADGKNFSLWPTYTWKYWLDTRKVNPKDYLLLNKCSQSYADIIDRLITIYLLLYAVH